MLQHEIEKFTPDNLFAATQLMPVVTGKITVASGQGRLSRGTLLTAAGTMCAKAAPEASEGSEVSEEPSADEVYAILADDIDATDAAVEAPVYFTGDFNEDALFFDDSNGATIDDFRASARKVSIFLRKNI